MLKPYTIENFRGLNIVDDPMELPPGTSLDNRNVIFDAGRMKNFPAQETFATLAANDSPQRLHAHGYNQVVAAAYDTVANETTLVGLDDGGTIIATQNTASVGNNRPWAFASVGTATATRTYAVRQGNQTRRWDGAAWANIAAIPQGDAASPDFSRTRLVVGGANGNKNRVWFSNQGDPEVYGANDFVDLSPGDGEEISAMAQWNNLMFVFKNTKFAVFYGENTDDEGNTEFVYRMVEGRGIEGRSSTGDRTSWGSGIAVGNDGVYFATHDGIYVTTGGPPRLISQNISPIWTGAGERPAYFGISNRFISQFAPGMGVHNGDLYVSSEWHTNAPKVDHPFGLLYHNGQWSRSDLWGKSFTNIITLPSIQKPLFLTINSNEIKMMDWASPSSYSLWEYESSYYDLGAKGMKRLRYTDFYGYGTIQAESRWIGDGGTSVGTPFSNVTMGTVGPGVEGYGRRYEGVSSRLFSNVLSGGTQMSLNKIEQFYSQSDIIT